jgi:4-carboxymuconolactone decarboxylase
MKPRPTPRLAPLPLESWDEESRAMFRGRIKVADQYLSGEPDAPRMPNVLGVFGHHVRLASAWLAYSGVLLDEPALDPRHRELLILRVAWRTGSTYEWAQHVRMGKRAGITGEEIDAVARGAEADSWTPLERDLLAATDQLIDQYQIDTATWSRLAEHLDPRQLLEALFVVGTYLCLALVFNSVGLELDPEMDGVPVPAEGEE